MRRQKLRRFKKTIALVVDGQCEIIYFQKMPKTEKMALEIKPQLPQKRTLEAIRDEIKNLANDYDKVVWIVDFDKIKEDSRKAKKGATTILDTFREYYVELSKLPNVRILVNNPCLEFWFLLHFKETNKLFDNGQAVCKELKKHLLNYSKKKNYQCGIYQELKPKLATAFKNASKLPQFDTNDCNTPQAEIYRLFDKLDNPIFEIK